MGRWDGDEGRPVFRRRTTNEATNVPEKSTSTVSGEAARDGSKYFARMKKIAERDGAGGGEVLRTSSKRKRDRDDKPDKTQRRHGHKVGSDPRQRRDRYPADGRRQTDSATRDWNEVIGTAVAGGVSGHGTSTHGGMENV